MRKIGLCAIALLMAAFFAAQPNISWADASKLSEAGAVLQEIQGIPETEIPPQLFRNAHGIAIIPDLIKGSFIVGARYGKGVLAANFGGKWSAPVFITMGGTQCRATARGGIHRHSSRFQDRQEHPGFQKRQIHTGRRCCRGRRTGRPPC